ncbi:hypothetical protein HYD83_02310 [Mycoplasmopsis bovis]|nr:hypothetical protein HYD83_02310 [Mycoplasmopsis bovis]
MPEEDTVPYEILIDKNGKEISDDSWDLSNKLTPLVITKIGFHSITKETLESLSLSKKC